MKQFYGAGGTQYKVGYSIVKEYTDAKRDAKK